jgi:hypothetical protein
LDTATCGAGTLPLAPARALRLAYQLSTCAALLLPAVAQAQEPKPAPSAQTAAPVAAEVSSPGCSPGLLSAEQRLTISSELGDVESRLAHLEYEQRDGRIAGPIAMVASGYGTALVALGVALVSFASAKDVQRWDAGDDWSDHLDSNDDGSIDADDELAFRRIARGFGVLSAIGAGVGIAGSFFLAKRMRVRRMQAPELRGLQRRRYELRRQLEYGANASARGLGVSLSGRF